jgi:para-nitrobenzyl esterase
VTCIHIAQPIDWLIFGKESIVRADVDVIVATACGRVRGRVEDGIATFRGIPYAAAPFGAHRFGKPAPAPEWDGVRDAVAFGPTAPKLPYPPPMDRLLPDPSIAGDECLNLNVWTPDPAGSGLPVLVWIHGGSFRNGSSSVPAYDGRAFARDGVVLVSINYRLGIEGFGVFPDAPANRGLLDQVAALRWVQDNVAAFGGDPANVTVFGESAGAIAIGALLASPLTSGLFRRAVMQSGPPIATSPSVAARTTALVGKKLGRPATAEAFATADRDLLLDAQLAVTRAGNPLTGANAFGVVTDADLVPTEPMAALRAGAGRHIDLLVGYNSEEYRLWFVPSGVVDRVNAVTLRLALAKFRIRARVARQYRRGLPGAKPGEVLGTIATDMLIRVPANRLADSRDGSNTFMYEFGWQSPVDRLGACHALEIGFVFDNLRSPDVAALVGPAAPQPLADVMHRAWVDFATRGAPGWDGWGPSRPVMRFDLPNPTVVHAPRDAELLLWRDVAPSASGSRPRLGR